MQVFNWQSYNFPLTHESFTAVSVLVQRGDKNSSQMLLCLALS